MAQKPQTNVKPARLKTESDLAAAIAALGKQCRIMRAITKRCGQPPLRDFPADFAGLAKIVTGQQVSAPSAAAIWGRLEAGIRPFDAKQLLARTEPELKALGLSTGKVKTLRAAAQVITDGGLDFVRLNKSSDDTIRAELTALHGIGPWTADIYLLFALRRADAFAAGDLALQLAVQRLFKLPERPSPETLLEIAERWRPWRGAAARLLWAEYAHAKLIKVVQPPKTGKPTA